MEETKIVFTEVSELYRGSTTSFGKWMWHNHVQWVADKASALAKKYGADAEKTYCAALLHDLADSWYESDAEVREIIEVIIHPHSCRPGSLPTTLEGKVLSTADSLFHLQTSFFPMLCYMHRPVTARAYEDWQKWFSEKIEREFTVKIFFKDEKSAAKQDYEALLRIFGNRTLDSQAP